MEIRSRSRRLKEPPGYFFEVRDNPPPGKMSSTSSCGREINCTDTSSPTRRAAAAPASVAAFTAPTSPRTITVTYPEPMYSFPMRMTLAALTMASAASIEATRPLVSIIPNASLDMRSSPRPCRHRCHSLVLCYRKREPSMASQVTQENAGRTQLNYCGNRFLGGSSRGRKHAASCGSDAVARAVLDRVHGFIGQVQQFDFGLGIRRIRSHSNARGEVNIQTFRVQPTRLADELVQPPRDDVRVFLGGLRQHDHKFVAAISKGKINSATRALH